MELRTYAYKTKQQKVRYMTAGELKLCILQYCAKKGYEFARIRINDIASATVDEYKTEKDYLLSGENEKWNLTVYSIKEMEIWNEEEKAIITYIVAIVEDAETDEADEFWSGF